MIGSHATGTDSEAELGDDGMIWTVFNQFGGIWLKLGGVKVTRLGFCPVVGHNMSLLKY